MNFLLTFFIRKKIVNGKPLIIVNQLSFIIQSEISSWYNEEIKWGKMMIAKGCSKAMML